MPHVVVKLWPGPTEAQKKELVHRIVADVVAALGTPEPSVSVGIVEVAPEDWVSDVYLREIAPNLGTLYKKPGYLPD